MKAPLGPKNKKRRLTLLGLVAVVLVAAAIAVPTVVLGQTPPPPKGPPPLPPRSGPGALAPPTPAVPTAIGEAFLIRGATITVAGKQIKLPDDASYELVTYPAWSVEVPPGTKLVPLPAYGIYRSGDYAAVSVETGEYFINHADVEPFRFLIQTLGREKMLGYNARAWSQAWWEWRQTGKLPDERQLPGPWDLPD
jgi:hypothetical protein